MGLSSFIARRLSFSRQKAFSSFIIKIATTAVALSVAVMIIATAFVNGFKSEIKRKVFGFNGHVRISSYESSFAFETKPIFQNPEMVKSIEALPQVKNVQQFSTKTCILQSEKEMEGIALKGIGNDFDEEGFKDYLIKGDFLNLNETNKSNEIILSKNTADLLYVQSGDKISAYFIQDPVRVRRFTISGIYNTGLAEYDRSFALVDIRHINKLNNWQSNQVQGYEVHLNNMAEMESVNDLLWNEILEPNLLSQTVQEINPSIFDWLELQNMTEQVIMILMVVVAVINMITALLILIMERTNMIGILKALGANNWQIRKIFIINAGYIVGFGLLIGNILGFIVCFLQFKFGWISLPEESYFLNVVPVKIIPWIVILINIATFLICVITLLLPSLLISRIKPVKAIRFE